MKFPWSSCSLLPSPTPAFHALSHFPLFCSSADFPYAFQRKLRPSVGSASFSLANQKPTCVFAHTFCLSSQPACSFCSPSQGLSSYSLALFLLHYQCIPLYWSFPTGTIILQKITFLTLPSPLPSLPFIEKPTERVIYVLCLCFFSSLALP